MHVQFVGEQPLAAVAAARPGCYTQYVSYADVSKRHDRKGCGGESETHTAQDDRLKSPTNAAPPTGLQSWTTRVMIPE